MNLASIGYLHSMQAIKLGEQSVRVLLYVVVVVLEDFAEELVFAVVDGFDDVLVISGEIEEASTLSRGAKFGKDILASQRDEIICRIETKDGAEMSKDPRRVILEFEVILCRRSKFVPGTVYLSAG